MCGKSEKNRVADCSQGVEERIRLLRQDFRRRMIAKHATLTACLHQSGINGTFTISDGTRLHEITHQLAGAGGTFGFADVSRAASAFDTLVPVANSLKHRKHGVAESIAVASPT